MGKCEYCVVYLICSVEIVFFSKQQLKGFADLVLSFHNSSAGFCFAAVPAQLIIVIISHDPAAINVLIRFIKGKSVWYSWHKWINVSACSQNKPHETMHGAVLRHTFICSSFIYKLLECCKYVLDSLEHSQTHLWKVHIICINWL